MNFRDLQYLLPGWEKEEKKGIAIQRIACGLAKDLFDSLIEQGRSDLAGKLSVDTESYSHLAKAILAACIFEGCRCSAKTQDEFWAVFYFARRQAYIEKRGIDELFPQLLQVSYHNQISNETHPLLLGQWVLKMGIPKTLHIETEALASVVGNKLCSAMLLWGQVEELTTRDH